MVDFAKLLKEQKEKKEKFGQDVTVRDEEKFEEIHSQICSGIFVLEHDHGCFRDMECTECSATIQKGVPGEKGPCGEDMTNYFYGTLPSKYLQQQGLLEELQK